MKYSSSRASGSVTLLVLAMTASLAACQSTTEISRKTDREITAGVCSVFKVVKLPARFREEAGLTAGEQRLRRETLANNAALRAYGCLG